MNIFLTAINFNQIENGWLKDPGIGFPSLKFSTANNLIDLITAMIPYTYLIAGIITFVILILGGFELLTSNGNQETVKKATGRITSALIGFVIVFISYWLIRIVEIILGIKIF